MNPSKSLYLFMVLFLVLGWTVVYPSDAQSMQDVPGVYIRIYINEMNTQGGVFGDLSEQALIKQISKKLSKAGIKVLTHKKWEAEPGMPFLYASIGLAKMTTTYLYDMELGLKQNVFLARNTALECTATTWSTNAVGVAKETKKVYDEADFLTQEFIDAYKAANSGQGKETGTEKR
jgi:hypothetical protein